MFKLFGRSPESAPAASQQPREIHRPTLPSVEASPKCIDALMHLGATPELIAVHLRTDEGGDSVVHQDVLIIGQLEAFGAVDPTATVTYLRARASSESGGKINVQPIVDTVETIQGPIINTPASYEAIAALYGACAADLPIEPGVESDVWKGNTPSLEVTIDGRRTAPLAPSRSIPIGSVAQPVRWDRVAVRAKLVKDRWATSVVSEHVLGKPRLKYEELSSTGISAEAKMMLVDFVLKDVEANGGDVGDVALRIRKAERETRHAEIVKREVPHRAIRSTVTSLSRRFRGQR